MSRICPSCEQYMDHPIEFEGKKFCNCWCALDWVENGRQSIRSRRKEIEEMKK